MGVQSETVYRLELRTDLTGKPSVDLPLSLPHGDLGEADRVVLSLRNASALDAGSLALLVRLHSQLAVRGKKFEIVEVASGVATVLERVGVLKLFSPARAPQAALNVGAAPWVSR